MRGVLTSVRYCTYIHGHMLMPLGPIAAVRTTPVNIYIYVCVCVCVCVCHIYDMYYIYFRNSFHTINIEMVYIFTTFCLAFS